MVHGGKKNEREKKVRPLVRRRRRRNAMYPGSYVCAANIAASWQVLNLSVPPTADGVCCIPGPCTSTRVIGVHKRSNLLCTENERFATERAVANFLSVIVANYLSSSIRIPILHILSGIIFPTLFLSPFFKKTKKQKKKFPFSYRFFSICYFKKFIYLFLFVSYFIFYRETRASNAARIHF